MTKEQIAEIIKYCTREVAAARIHAAQAAEVRELVEAAERALALMPTGEYTPAQESDQEALRVRKALRTALAKHKEPA